MVTLDVRLNVLRCRADILDTHMLHALSTEAVWFIREIAGSGWRGGGRGGIHGMKTQVQLLVTEL